MEIRWSRILTVLDTGFLIYMVVCTILFVKELIGMIFLWENTVSVFLLLFLAAIGGLYMIGVMFTVLCDSTCVVTIDENGVRNRNRFYEEYLAWEEVKDYGVIEKRGKFIYFSGRRFSSKERLHLHKVVLIRPESVLETAWYPSVIRKRNNQRKKDIIIRMEYTDERWEYICSLASHRKKVFEKRLGELGSDTRDYITD